MKSEEDKPVVVRMAPSPTGFVHIGTARTALFNFLFARKNKGTFIFRSEDTNVERSRKEYEENIIETIKWLGLTYDQFMRQSDRTDIYKSYLKKMIDGGFAYVSKEEPKEADQRTEVIRLKNPNKKIIIEDMVLGQIEFDTTESGDIVIAKSLDEPLYHLAVVVDDFEMGITHVIRGDDILASTARHILIQEAIGAPRPIYGHIPMILAPDRSKLSKRHGAISVEEYRNRGYLPAAIINYIALLGWNPGTEQEIFSLDELVNAFDMKNVNKSGAIFDEEKLKWINKEHMKKLPESVVREEINKQIIATKKGRSWKNVDDVLAKAWMIIFERISRWSDVGTLIESGDLDYMFGKPEYNSKLLFWKEEKDVTKMRVHLEKTSALLQNLSDSDWNSENIKNAVFDYATKEGRGNVLWPMRVALSGKEKSPDPFTLAEILGKAETVSRLREAQVKLA